jgi:pyridoxine kinase
MGPAVVLLTSFREGQHTGALSPEDVPEHVPENPIGMIGTMIEMIVSAGGEAYRLGTPELYFEDSTMMAGSGDLTAAVFLSRYLETRDICRTLELTAASVYGIMEMTHKAGSKELLLVEAQNELVSPGSSFKADRIL